MKLSLDNKIYEKIVSNTPNGIIIMNQDSRIIFLNDSAEEITGVKKEFALSQPFIDIFPQMSISDIDSKDTRYYRCMMNNKNLYLKRFGIYNDAEQLIAVVLIIQEFTKLMKLADELEHTQKTLRELQMILDNSFDGFLVTDGDGKVLMVNQAYERLTALKMEEMIGKNMKDMLNPDYMKNAAPLIVLEEKKTVSLHHATKHGRNIIVTGTPVYDEEGRIYRVVVNVRDISEIYSLRQELLKAKEMEKLYFKQLRHTDDGEYSSIVVVSEEMKALYSLARKVSGYDVGVLILGDSGVGKEVVAKYIHENSLRKDKPFIAINCGAIPENLLESELFGYEPGAFTGASSKGKEGLFEAANDGILFLDEIGELPVSLQVKLLRVLETGEVKRIGATKPAAVNVRILAATNRDLEKMVEEKLFREDLFYRLNVVRIRIPPLKERIDDVAPLSMYFLQKFNKKYGQQKKLTYDAIKELERYPWPGNIRELKNVIETMVVIKNNEYLQINDLPWYDEKGTDKMENCARVTVQGIMPMQFAIEEMEKQMLKNALHVHQSSRKIGKALGIDQSTVVRKINKYGLGKDKQSEK